ncbi:MAG: hypothetical protein Q8R04_06860, partial [Nanoarchaeota archaeon]|nr:hypothetical protein [Nanoarchaeota archaeon]
MLKPNKKIHFYQTKEFKLFITAWIVYIFYMQMFGSSSMANTQSALTAAIVNEGRFEIDTYYKAGGNGNAYYNGYYYSGQAPGISFISVPMYFISRQFFYLVPDSAIDFMFEKLEKYGEKLPADWEGEKRILSNFFPALGKRQILEYVIISGLILPMFTTSLIAALSVALLYSLLAYFTKDNKLRMAIALLYAFGTIVFPLSTEFFERPIAISMLFFAFAILFKVKHEKIKPKKSSFLAAGILAGISAWFDYFHIALAGLLFFYLLSMFRVSKNNSSKVKAFFGFDFSKEKFYLILAFSIGVILPLLVLGLYQYMIFDNPFTTSYTHRIIPEFSLQLSGLHNLALPNAKVLFNMAIFFLYSPIILIALYGLLKALLKKDEYFGESLLSLAIIIATLAFSTLVVLSYFKFPATIIESSFKRYMKPMLPYAMLFIPYAFKNMKINGKSIMWALFIVFGIISVFMNWLSAQFGGHAALGHFDLKAMKFVYIERFLETGPSSSFLSTFSGTFGLNSFIVNIFGLLILLLGIYFVWKPSKTKSI